ncbi:beta-L-arabinofuranosidase domain-containing protein [Paenibacillus algorifonticola]|uniref:glycoside hydrolase family 127 protein n=1 Tax=Paenibacillus algorifonticola TaxID=684063 RepID=UPI003D288744
MKITENTEKWRKVSYKSVKIHDPFWSHYRSLVRDEVIPYQWEAINDRVEGASPSHALQNYRIAAGEAEGAFYGYVFQDSDVTKWLEAVAYSLQADPNAELEKLADETIDLLGKAQQPNGYLNTYFTIQNQDQRWTNERDNHETYCAGHLIEAAVAYYETTGKRKLLDIACKLADHIDSVYGEEQGKLRGYPGHQEVELALMKLYNVTGKERYLKLCRFFIDERGQEPHYFKLEAEKRAEKRGREALLREGYYFLYKNNYEYNQAHLPVREQLVATGHAVRAVYMYTGMAELAGATNDTELLESCKRLWKNVTQRQMYVTGGIGSNHDGEAFSFDYDLPNDTAYTETCASIGLVFWAQSMLHLDPDSKYADVIERALYNGTISGMGLDGKSFFYVNPLEVWPAACKRPDKRHVKTSRQKWFGCACCPPNLARLIASLGSYIYSQNEHAVYVHQYIGSETTLKVAGQNVSLSLQANFPWEETVAINVTPERDEAFTIAVRIPDWCDGAETNVNGQAISPDSLQFHKGYAAINRIWQAGDQIALKFPMAIKRLYAHPLVRANAGKVALQRGPVVYCLEEADNGAALSHIALPEQAALAAHFKPDLLGGIVVIEGQAVRGEQPGSSQRLYESRKRGEHACSIRAIPYYAWANRGEGEMAVWIRES